MKVKVRIIAAPYKDVPTASLQAILQNHAHGKLRVRISTRHLYEIMGELARRREASGTPFRSNQEAWEEFQEHYMSGNHNDKYRSGRGYGQKGKT